jgi:hypothetical protein
VELLSIVAFAGVHRACRAFGSGAFNVQIDLPLPEGPAVGLGIASLATEFMYGIDYYRKHDVIVNNTMEMILNAASAMPFAIVSLQRTPCSQ